MRTCAMALAKKRETRAFSRGRVHTRLTRAFHDMLPTVSGSAEKKTKLIALGNRKPTTG